MSFLGKSEAARPQWLKFPLGLLALILVVAAAKTSGRLASEALSKEADQPLSKEQISTVLKKIQAGMRDQLPIRVDPQITWMDVIVVNSRISYIYSLNVAVPLDRRADFISNVLSSNRSNFCDDQGFRRVIDSGGSISWLYKEQGGEVIEAVLDTCN